MAKLGRGGDREAVEKVLDKSSICGHWMTTKVRTVSPSDSIARARDILRRYRINQLPVVRGGKLLGIVTDRDIRGISSTADKSNAKARVESVMSHPAITLGRHSTLLNAAEVMRRTRIGSVPIVQGDTLVGIVTRSDILEAFVAFAHGHYDRPRKTSKRSTGGKTTID